MGPTALLPLRRKCALRIFILGRVWTRNKGSRWKHANHKTLEGSDYRHCINKAILCPRNCEDILKYFDGQTETSDSKCTFVGCHSLACLKSLYYPVFLFMTQWVCHGADWITLHAYTIIDLLFCYFLCICLITSAQTWTQAVSCLYMPPAIAIRSQHTKCPVGLSLWVHNRVTEHGFTELVYVPILKRWNLPYILN
jgi:hypothetical protein